jgi:GT2 family glycosyltransferase
VSAAGIEPTVAVVVATHNRPELLRRCLAAIVGQSRPPDELIVVDDASDPAVVTENLGVAGALRGFSLVRSDTAGGPARARNRGWPRVHADYVAFTDDDCRPSPGWLAALMSAAAPRHLVVGRVRPDPQDGAMSSVLDRSMVVDSDDGRFSTCNVLYPRALLEELGGFDTSIDMYGEDTDLGQRAMEAGATSSFAADALVDHAVHHLTMRGAVRDRLRLREMPQLVRRHPHLRYSTCSGHFVRDSHRSLLFGLAGLGVLPLGRFGLRSSRRWINDATDRVPPELRHGRRLSQQVMLLAALDAVEVAACARGSMKSRTLML